MVQQGQQVVQVHLGHQDLQALLLKLLQMALLLSKGRLAQEVLLVRLVHKENLENRFK